MDIGKRLYQALLVFIVILSFSMAFCDEAYAQTPSGEKFEKYAYLEFQPQFALESEGDRFGTIQLIQQRSRWFGIYVEAAHGNYWGETAIGPSFQLTDELNFSAATAVSHYEHDGLRGRFNLYYDSEVSGSFFYTELGVGKSGHWIAVDAVRMLGSKVGIGALLQMPGGGVGPKMELRLGDHVGLWVAPVYEWREKTTRVLVGGRLMFEK